MTIQIIIDCDPGHDDAIALLLALASPEIDLLGVTTVHGNQTLDKTTDNALRVLALVGQRDVPVAMGPTGRSSASRTSPRTSTARAASTGRSSPAATAEPVAQHAVEFIAERSCRRRPCSCRPGR